MRPPLDRGRIFCYKHSQTAMIDSACTEQITYLAPASWSSRYAWRFS